jgi:uncharacterized protein involved in exopolysaccharide biosynthesis
LIHSRPDWSKVSTQASRPVVEEGIDSLTFLTPLLEKRRKIIAFVILASLTVGLVAFFTPRKYKAELSVTPVLNNRASQALGGIAALAGATLQQGYQLTPARMVELIRSRRVLACVGMSPVTPNSNTMVIERFLGEEYTRNDPEEVAKHLQRLLTVTTNKETGTITVSVAHRDSALARMIAARTVDSASQIFVRTSKAQAQQLRVAQEARVAQTRQQLARAEEELREFNFSNRAAPAYSQAAVERGRLQRNIMIAEQVYTQAATDQESAFARELEATPTVVVHDPLPDVLSKVRKRVVMKTVIAAVVSFLLACALVMIAEIYRRRLAKQDEESMRFKEAVSSLPGLRRRRTV